MTALQWDKAGERTYETGVSNGVLYLQNSGIYDQGVAWNGLTTLTESPSGAESNKQYADNMVYLNLLSVEQFGGTIEAFTYPDEWAECDGSAVPTAGVSVGQQPRRTFGLSYQTKVGNDMDPEAGVKIHLVYGALAAPSEKAYATVNDSPEAMGLSWDISTTPVEVPGTNPTTGKPFKPTASLSIDSTQVDATAMQTLKDTLYGTAGNDPRLPLPAEVIAMFSGTVTQVAPTPPTYNNTTHTITIPTVAGVNYYINDVLQTAGPVVITEDTVVNATPAQGYKFPAVTDDDWYFDYS
jgi:hypothetical protein